MATQDLSVHTDFYVAGGTLRADAPSYIPRQADEDLYAALSRGEFCYVLTSRQMGKSSLMVRTAMRLREDDATVVVLDLTSYGQNVTAEQWYFSLLTTVGQRLDIEDELDDFWTDNESLTPLHRWMEAFRQVVLDRVEGRVVVFVDEIDVVQSLPFSTGEFFAGIRECYTRRAQDPEFERMAFCLVGVATPSDLIEDPLTTPFNIGTRIDLGDFQAREAARLAAGLGRDESTAGLLVGRILHWTGGHPYLTQRLCAAVASDATVTDGGAVDRLCSDLFFSERAQEQDDNLLFVRNQMLHRDTDHASLLNLYEQVRRGKDVRYDETDPFVNILRLAGIVRVDRGSLAVRNRIYESVFDRAWVVENMPGAELRRQKAAFRRGLLGAAAGAAAIVAIVGALAVVALNQRNQAIQLGRDLRVERGEKALREGDSAGLLDLVAATRDLGPGQDRDLLMVRWAAWHQKHKGRLVDMVGDEDGVAVFKMSQFATWFATAGHRGSAQLWRAAGRTKHGAVLNHGQPVTGLMFDATESTLATQSADGTAKLWDVETATLRATVQHPGPITDRIFTRDGAFFGTMAMADMQTFVFRRWDSHTGQLVAGPHTYRGLYATVGQDGVILASPSPQRMDLFDSVQMGRVGVWYLRAPPSANGQVDASETWGTGGLADGSVLLGKYVSEWFATGAPERVFGPEPGEGFSLYSTHQRAVTAVAISGDGTVLASVTSETSGMIAVIRAGSGEPLGQPIFHSLPVDGIRLTYDGSFLAAMSGDTIRVWSTDTGKKVLGPLSHQRSHSEATGTSQGNTDELSSALNVIRALAFSRSDPPELFVQTASDQPVYVYRVSSTAERETVVNYPAAWHITLALSDDDSTLATGAMPGGDADIWYSETGVRRGDLVDIPDVGWIRHQRLLALTADGAVAAIRSAANVQQYASEFGAPLGSAAQCDFGALDMEYSPDGKWLALAEPVGVKLWDAAETDSPPRTLDVGGAVNDLAFDRGGSFLAVAVGSDVRFVNPTTGEDVFPPLSHPLLPVRHLALSRDGTRAATATADNVTRVWDIHTGASIGPALSHTNDVYDVAFHPVGDAIAVAFGPPGAQLWDIETGREYGLPISASGGVEQMAFAADGERLFTAGGSGGSVIRWRLPDAPTAVDEMGRLTSIATGLREGADGEVERVPASDWRGLRAQALTP